MADDRQEERTEQPSDRRMREAREEGRVPIGRDAVTWASFALTVMALGYAGPGLAKALTMALTESIRAAGRHDVFPVAAWQKPLVLGLGVAAAAAAGAIAASVAQTQGGLWTNLVTPDLSRLGQGRFTRLFSGETAADLGLACVKVLALGGTLWWALHDDFVTLGALAHLPPGQMLADFASRLSHAAIPVLLTAAALAGLDLAVTRRRFFAGMRMTRDELKREMKEEEGDPLIRQRRRARHRELAKGSARKEVPRADVVVVNPTHVAVAIRYRRGESKAPLVLCKGKGSYAENIRDLARQHGIPIVEDIWLARLLYKKVKVGREVPAETYKAIASILAFVYRRTGRAARAAA
jgi:flagellar biosynthesis protein FlhB